MKKTVKLLALTLTVALLAVVLVSCGKYGALKKAFEDAGYKESETLEGLTQGLMQDFEQEEAAVKLHFFVKDLLSPSALVVEFNSTKAMVEKVKNSENLQKSLKSIKEDEDVKKAYDALVEAGFAKGNCLIVPIAITPSGFTAITDIVKGA